MFHRHWCAYWPERGRRGDAWLVGRVDRLVAAHRAPDVVGHDHTTGHEWDGIRELNKPLPRWWVWTFYATIVWAIGYWIVYPAFPTLTGYTKGLIGYSQRTVVTDEVSAALAAQAQYRSKLAATPRERIKDDPDLLRFGRRSNGCQTRRV